MSVNNKEDNQGLLDHVQVTERVKPVLDFKKYTKQIWLAGLGAFSRAEEEGVKLFDALVKLGEELESKSIDTPEKGQKITGKTRESILDTKEKVERMIDQSVHHTLNRLGLVTPKDLQHIEQLILALQAKLDLLIEQQKDKPDQDK